MRRFNPEKELYKIQHGNRNKVILGVFLLLIILGISSSYALYQVRYSKRIIYTKVAPISTGDLDLAIYVDGKPDKLPSKGTAYVDNIECDNTSNLQIYWDYDKWTMDIPSIEIPNKCKISFSKNDYLTSYLKYRKIDGLIDDETSDHNLRFIDSSPKNYIWFNCSDYNGLTQSTATTKCEKWRIIGVMNNITKSDATKESLVKIIRDTKLIDTAWDTNDSNIWANSSLQKLLNEDYLNPNSGTYTSSTSTKAINNISLNMIETIRWNIGAVDASTYTASEYYNKERGTLAPSGAQPTWIGKIGLIYVSDYAYAVGNRSYLDTTLNNWGKVNSWILDTGMTQWTITPAAGTSNLIVFVSSDGFVLYDHNNLHAATSRRIRPVLYLKSNTKISLDGDGSSKAPYILVP